MTDTDLGRFLRLVAHDLQNQLGAIDLNLQVIPSVVHADESTAKAMEPFMNHALSAAHDLNETLTDIQAYGRVLSAEDDERAPFTELNLTPKVNDCGLALMSMAKARKIDLQISAPPVDVKAHGRDDDIRRALKILVTETLRNSFPGSTVSLTLISTAPPRIEISSSQEGLFEKHRPTLGLFLAAELLRPSGVELDYPVSSKSVLGLDWT